MTGFTLINLLEGDAIRVTSSYTKVEFNTIIDVTNSCEAHRDAIQIIPTRADGMYNTQYAAACAENINIFSNHIHSDGQLQGIFCSDGLLRDIIVMNNLINTQSPHKITLNGLLSGYIKNNYVSNGETCPITLNPLRIGGGNNVWVLSFASSDYKYQPLERITQTNWTNITDNRFDPRKLRGVFLRDFDLDGYVDATLQSQLDADGMALLARNFGTEVVFT